MEFRNKETKEIVKANSYAERFAFSHNSNYELVEPKEPKKETAKPKEPKKETAKPKEPKKETAKPKEPKKEKELAGNSEAN